MCVFVCVCVCVSSYVILSVVYLKKCTSYQPVQV